MVLGKLNQSCFSQYMRILWVKFWHPHMPFCKSELSGDILFLLCLGILLPSRIQLLYTEKIIVQVVKFKAKDLSVINQRFINWNSQTGNLNHIAVYSNSLSSCFTLCWENFFLDSFLNLFLIECPQFPRRALLLEHRDPRKWRWNRKQDLSRPCWPFIYLLNSCCHLPYVIHCSV